MRILKLPDMKNTIFAFLLMSCTSLAGQSEIWATETVVDTSIVDVMYVDSSGFVRYKEGVMRIYKDERKYWIGPGSLRLNSIFIGGNNRYAIRLNEYVEYLGISYAEILGVYE